MRAAANPRQRSSGQGTKFRSARAATAVRRALPIIVLLALLTQVTGARASGNTQAAASGCQAVHVGPRIGPGLPPSSYFELQLASGEVAHPALVIANPQPHPCEVEVQPAYGKTATNSGDTYPVTGGSSSTCVRTSCWLSGLPARVTVPSRSRINLAFTVRVPAGTPPGEYLAGVVAGPVGSPAAIGVTQAEAGAIVIARVGIGVAVRVPGRLSPEIAIPDVTLGRSGSGILYVTVTDGGNTWEHPRGRVLVEVGRVRRRFQLAAATILPGGRATLPLAVSGISTGVWPTEVELWYDHHRLLATWLGSIGYRDVPRATTRRGSHVIRQPAVGGLPAWTSLAIGSLTGLSIALLVILLALVGARRRRERGMIVLRPVSESREAP